MTHAQFETIHPFLDGNGRTGRALVQSMLRATGVTRNVTVPVSAGILSDVDAYHRALTAYRDGHPDDIIELVNESTFRAVANGKQLVDELGARHAEWIDRLSLRSDSGAWRLLEYVRQQPVFTADMAAAHLGVTNSNVYRLIDTLVVAEILKPSQIYRGSRVWRSDDVLGALDRFAERVGKRRRANRLS